MQAMTFCMQTYSLAEPKHANIQQAHFSLLPGFTTHMHVLLENPALIQIQCMDLP